MPPVTHSTFLFFSPPAVRTACQELGWHGQFSSLCELSPCLSLSANCFFSCLSNSDIKPFFFPLMKTMSRTIVAGQVRRVTYLGQGEVAYGWFLKALAVKMDRERTGGDAQRELCLPEENHLFSLDRLLFLCRWHYYTTHPSCPASSVLFTEWFSHNVMLLSK